MCTSIRMASALFLLSAFSVMALGQGGASAKPTLVINEFMAQNTSSIQDSHGDYDDWIELYNYGGSAVDVAGFYLTDDLKAPTKWRVPAGDPSVTTIPAHGFLLVWADQEPDQGLLHADFKLSAGGESLGLSDAQANLLDSLTFQAQEADVSYGRLPDGADQWQYFSIPTPGKSNQAAAASVIISEIMYHPAHVAPRAEDLRQEWIELFNAGAAPVNMTGWRLSDGVDFVFPAVVLEPGAYLVVAADTSAFSVRHPDVKNVVGGWTGWLSNSGERIMLVDEVGEVINEVRYSDEGDWAVRELGPVDQSQRGWQWSDQTDGGGKSLELMNAALPNEFGQNWAASLVDGGTPGKANSVATGDIAPMILEVQHSPAIPGPADSVTVTARVIDEAIQSTTVRVHYRVDRSTYTTANVYPQTGTDYLSVTMADDGGHGDGAAGDGVYGAQIPAHPDGTIIEFYVEAIDGGGHIRTWPAPSDVDGRAQQVTNALYRVDAAIDPDTYWHAGAQPLHYLVMTEMERGRLAYIGTHSTLQGPNSAMNATFISVDGVGTDVRYNLNVRNRGHGTRNQQPNEYRVDFPHDKPWKGIRSIELNTNWTYVDAAGYAVFQMADMVSKDAYPVQARVNGQNLAPVSMTRTSGSYEHVEVVNGDWAKHHIPLDSGGNAYKCMRSDSPAQEANLRYLGTNPDSYRICYSKHTNGSDEDWTDLIELTRVLSDTTSDAVYAEQVQRVANVEEWLRFLAVDALLDNSERSIGNGTGDEYFLYRGVEDKRFIVIPHDLEALFGLGDELAPSTTHDIFRATAIAALNRLMKHPQFAPRYYWHLKDLADGIFSDRQIGEFLDERLGGWVAAATIDKMKSFTSQRVAYVLSVIPQRITVTSVPAAKNNIAYTTSKQAPLAGQADAINTRRVTVNGQPAVWTAWQAMWSIANVSLLPGINRVVIQAFDASDREIDRSSVDVWYDTGTMATKAGGTLSADETWTAVAGPYHVTGNITIPAGHTLTVEPGATVFLDAAGGFAVNGQLAAQGTEYQRIRFTRIPGSSGSWRGFQFTNARQPNVLAYADIEFGDAGSQCISIHNSQVLIDWATFFNMRSKYFDVWEPQVTIRHSTFGNLGGTYFCTTEHLLSDGWFVVQGNLFGKDTGDNDIFHLNRVSVKGGAAAMILDNVFSGGGDDMVDDNESDTHIEGNLFMHANEGNSANHGASAAVTTGPGGGTGVSNLLTQHLTVVRNVFYRNDYGIISKTGAYSQIYNNVFIGNRGAIMFDETDRNDAGPGRAGYIESCIFWNNQPEDLANASGALVDVNDPRAFDSGRLSRGRPQVTVNNCILPAEFHSLGTDNTDADPLFVDADRQLFVDVNLPRFSTGFPGYAEGGYLLEGMVPDVHLLPESSARGAGFNGVDMGFYVPAAASIDGVPTSPTSQTSATLTVAGLDIYGYKYRLIHSGVTDAWSREMQQMKPVVQILLSGAMATVTCNNHGYTNGDLIQIMGADALTPYFNGTFAISNVTANTFSYPVVLGSAPAQNQTQPRDLWCRKTEPIQLTGLTNGTYAVDVIRKNSQGIWQDANQPTTAAWTVDTSIRRLVINEVLAANRTAYDHEGTFPDVVELYYDGPTAMSLAGMSLSDDPQQPDKFVFPAGTTIAPGKYLVLFADANAATSGLHLGFALADEGDAVYLYDKNGALLDSVQFGQQLPDLSIGRVGPGGQWQLAVPTPGQANIAYPQGRVDTLKINEWLANGLVLFANDFIEIYNPHPDPVDLGGLYLTDNPVTQPNKCKIRPLTFVAGNGHAVFWADNSSDPGHVSFRLSADEGMIGLFDSQLKEIDKVLYGPQTTDVSEGRSPDGAGDIQILPLPTPGVANPQLEKTTATTVVLLNEQANKRVLVPTGAVSDDWKGSGGRPFDDSAWTLCSGAPGGVGYEKGQGYESLITLDTSAQMYGSGKNNSCYIRIPFTVAANTLADATGLTLKVRYDDGFVAYLNGIEVARANFTGTPSWNSHADSAIESVGQGFDDYIDISQYKDDMKAGANILAVHAMNSGNTSSDFLFNAAIDAVSAKTEGQTSYERELSLLAGLRITELMYHSPQGGSGDYVELMNVGDKVLDVNGVRFSNGISFVFPAMVLQPGEYTLVVANLAAFQSAYGAGLKVAGQYDGNLSNAGEEVVLQLPAPLDAAILRFSYSNTWYAGTDGGGKSLAIRNPAAAPATWNDPASWQESPPTPGKP